MQNPQSPRLNTLENFDLYIEQLGRALGYTDGQLPALRESFQNFNRQDRYKLIQNTQPVVERLLAVDQQLQSLALPNGILAPYMNEIGTSWNQMNEQLAQLQILSLIQKKEDCQEVIKELLRILNDKIRTVNDVLRANLGQPSNPQQPQQDQNPQQPQQQDQNPQGGVARQNFQSIVNRANPNLSRPNFPGQRFADVVQADAARFGPRAQQNQGQAGGSNDDVSLKKNSI
jgi:hypothetical protein